MKEAGLDDRLACIYNHSVNRGAGLLLLLLVTAAGGQVIEGRVLLPDSFGVFGVATGSVCDTVQGKVYYGGAGAVGVLAGPLGRRVGRIEVGGAVNHFFHGLHLDPGLNRLYSLAGYDTLISVIDPLTDSVVGTMTSPQRLITGDGVEQACLNTQNHKLYVAAGGEVAVFDASAGTFLRLLDSAPHQPRLCYNPRSNKVYGLHMNEVWIIDGATDSVRNIVPAGNGASWIKCLARCDKVYVTNLFGASVTVIDGAGDTLIRHIPTPPGPAKMTMNGAEGKVYVGCGDGYAVIDGYGDSVRTYLPAKGAWSSAWNPRTNRAYLTSWDRLVVVDGVTDSVVAEILQPVHGSCAVVNPVSNIIYFTQESYSFITAIDGSADTVLWSEYSGMRCPEPACWSSRHRKLYLPAPKQFGVMSVGMHPFIPPRRIPIPFHTYTMNALALDDKQGKLYASELVYDVRQRLFVVSCSTETVVDTIQSSGMFGDYFCAVEERSRLYCPQHVGRDSHALAIIDTDRDSVVALIPTSTTSVWADAYSPVSGKLYWPDGDAVLVVDVSGDSLLRRVLVSEQGPACHIYSMAWHPPTNRIYIAIQDNGPPRVKVLDCAADSVVAEFLSGVGLSSMCYSPVQDKLFAATIPGTMRIVDPRENRVVGGIRIPNGLPWSRCVYNPRSDRAYMVTTPVSGGALALKCYVVAVDCASWETTWLDVGYEPLALGVDPDSGYVFAACANSVVYVIKDQLAGGIAEMPEPPSPRVTLEVKPNPSFRGAEVRVRLPAQTRVALKILNSAGRVIGTLLNEEHGPGIVQVYWDGTDGRVGLPAGTYFIRLEAGNERLTRKLVLPR